MLRGCTWSLSISFEISSPTRFRFRDLVFVLFDSGTRPFGAAGDQRFFVAFGVVADQPGWPSTEFRPCCDSCSRGK